MDFIMDVNDILDICAEKTKKNIKKMKLGLREYPGNTEGNYFDVPEENTKSFEHIMNWTASFFTGMAILSFDRTKDMEYLKWLNAQYPLYYSKVFDNPEENMHDMGFLFSLYSVGLYRLTGDLNHRKVALKAADELAKRFVENGEYIRAWGRMDNKIPDYVTEEDKNNAFFVHSRGLAIIDCMMNLPLLFFASEETGEDFYKTIAIKHADTTMKHFIRKDNSVYHAFRFGEDGHPIGGCNYCGYGDESYWARGTTWAIYGFAIAYGYTKKEEYLDIAIKLALAFTENLDGSYIPVWDFRLPDEEPKNVDTSAAAIAVCGFYEILKHKEVSKLREYADKILDELKTEKYTDCDTDVPGILKEQNGEKKYTSYGDYYFYLEG